MYFCFHAGNFVPGPVVFSGVAKTPTMVRVFWNPPKNCVDQEIVVDGYQVTINYNDVTMIKEVTQTMIELSGLKPSTRVKMTIQAILNGALGEKVDVIGKFIHC